ncbi:MAG: hypothetical protein RIS45_1686 [Planctomycetota bacterium]
MSTRSRSRDRSRPSSGAPGVLSLDFRISNAFGYSLDTVVPAGCAYTRTACVGSVQSGTSGLYDYSGFGLSVPNMLVWGRASDAWETGLVLEEARTNLVLNARNFNAASWITAGTATRTTGQADALGGTGATRVQVASGTNVLAETGTGTLGALAASVWILGAAPNFNVFRATPALVAATTAASPSSGAAWGRISVLHDAQGSASSLEPVDGRDWAAQGGLVAGARDVILDCCQREAGSFPTEFIPTTGSTATRAASFLRALSATWAGYALTGRVSLEFVLRPKGARTEYSGSTTLWYVDASNQATFVPSTGVLTITVAGGTNTVTLPSWARYDLVELSVQAGGGVATVVKYRLNGGSVTSLAVTGSALGTHATGDMYLCSTSSAQHLSCWLYAVRYYRSGGPSWAA